jgi:hypothetical protein
LLTVFPLSLYRDLTAVFFVLLLVEASPHFASPLLITTYQSICSFSLFIFFYHTDQPVSPHQALLCHLRRGGGGVAVLFFVILFSF